MKFSVLILALFLTGKSYGQANPFLSLKYDKVVMYDFEGGKGIGILSIIDENGKLASTISKQIILDQGTIQKLSSKLGSKSSYGGSTAACFDPHLGFVYYFRSKVVGHTTICLECNRLASSIKIPAQHRRSHNINDDRADGLSKSFRLFVIELLRRYKFSHIPKI